MKLIVLALLVFAACSKRDNGASIEHSDDYVLVEFASKLEEDYHKIEQIKSR